MKKTVINKKLTNPKNERELIALFVFDKLNEVEESITEESILNYFIGYETPIPPKIIKLLLPQIKSQIKQLRYDFEMKLNKFKYSVVK